MRGIVKVLALDTSCMMGSVALVEDDSVIAEQLLNIKVTHSERLIPSIEAVLDTAGIELSDVDGFAVAIGPGSFTGLRIGLAAVKGFAFTRKRPVVGISSLKALAYNVVGTGGLVASTLDARRGEFYIGVNKFKRNELETILEDTVLPPDKLIDYVEKLLLRGVSSEAGRSPFSEVNTSEEDLRVTFVGDGVHGLKELIDERLKEKAIIPPPAMIHPRASNIAWLGLKRIKAGDTDDLKTLVPNYIRRSDAEK